MSILKVQFNLHISWSNQFQLRRLEHIELQQHLNEETMNVDSVAKLDVEMNKIAKRIHTL